MKKTHHIPTLLCLALLVAACRPALTEHEITGNTMGTTYHIKVVATASFDARRLKESIRQRLEGINQELSTYISDSEISRFNRRASVEKPQPVSPDFFRVMSAARKIYELSQGAWDGTVKPLVDLWGFGSRGPVHTVPDAEEIHALMATVGFDRIDMSADGRLGKTSPGVTVDLASIAKGFAVDRIADLIRDSGVKDFIVEIGGEVYASGLRKDKNKWRVGVNTPRSDASPEAVYQAVPLHNQGMATSGDYRNFFEVNGIRYAHIIDPRTGYPVDNGVVSASVISDTCTFADGMATALVVMGARRGVALADRVDRMECLIVVLEPDGALTNHYSKGFPR